MIHFYFEMFLFPHGYKVKPYHSHLHILLLTFLSLPIQVVSDQEII